MKAQNDFSNNKVTNPRDLNTNMKTDSIEMIIYRAEMYILNNYPHLIDLNKRSQDIDSLIPDNCIFIIIRSIAEEDIHKAIKYNIWSSTNHGTKILNQAFEQAQQNGGNVYLFFTANSVNRFIGLAMMKSPIDYSKMFPLWTHDNYYKGLFEIEWLFIKDVPYHEFKSIILPGDKQVFRARDCQEVNFEDGKKMYKIFQDFINSNTIIEHFEYYDMRQESYLKQNMGNNN